MIYLLMSPGPLQAPPAFESSVYSLLGSAGESKRLRLVGRAVLDKDTRVVFPRWETALDRAGPAAGASSSPAVKKIYVGAPC